MTESLSTLFEYLTYDFVWYALTVGVLIALCSSLLGVTLVLKRMSFIGNGLSHVAFGAMAAAAVTGLTNQMAIVLPVTVLCAVILLKTGRNAKINGDAAVAIISVSALAIGYLIMNKYPTSSNVSADVCTTLFGSTKILTLSAAEVWLSAGLSVVAVAAFVILYNKVFAVTFDENFARATGIRTGLYNFIMAVIIAVVIVLAVNLVGSLLISALIIFPALSAMRVFKNFKAVTVCSAVHSVICAALGILLSILFATPVGPTIVAVELAVFAGFFIAGLFINKRKRG